MGREWFCFILQGPSSLPILVFFLGGGRRLCYIYKAATLGSRAFDFGLEALGREGLSAQGSALQGLRAHGFRVKPYLGTPKPTALRALPVH